MLFFSALCICLVPGVYIMFIICVVEHFSSHVGACLVAYSSGCHRWLLCIPRPSSLEGCMIHLYIMSLVIQPEEHGEEPVLWRDSAVEFCLTQHFLHIWELLHQDPPFHILGTLHLPSVLCTEQGHLYYVTWNVYLSELDRTYMSWGSILSSSRVSFLFF